MKSIEINDLFKYRFLSNLKAAPSAERLAFAVKSCSENDNSYLSSIYLYENGKTKKLTGLDKESSFFWQDDEHILFPTLRSDRDKKRAKDGEAFTAFYRLDIFGGEAEKAFELPISCNSMEHLSGDLWFFTASVDMRYPDFYKLPKKRQDEICQDLEKENDYHILTRNPWWFNGEGFLNENVSVLFVYNMKSGKLCRVSDEKYNVDCTAALDGKIYYSASKIHAKSENISYLFTYDPESDSTACIDESGKVMYFYRICAYQQRLLCLAVFKGCKYGLNTNAALSFFDPYSLSYIPVSDPDLAPGSSVGSDVRLGGGEFMKVVGDELYMIHTKRNAAILQKLLPNGEFAPVCEHEGSIDCFDITKGGNIYGIGLYNMTLQELYSIDKEPIMLTSFNKDAVMGKYIAMPEKLTVNSQGWDIDGWVLFPKDYDPMKKYPAVFDIHGGPKTVYGEVFYHEMQVFASKGWFVFFCNPFGSDGRGNEFMDIRGKYGTTDYENLMDFTTAVLEKYPQIDKTKVGVTGGSYGGFMTNWIIGHTDRFVCAATQRSISNWVSFYGVSDIGIDFTKNEQDCDIFSSHEKLWWHSPIKYAGNVKTPTLFIHSDEDYRCPISEGLQLYTALVDRGVEARFVWFKGENHELSRGGKPLHRIKRLTEITGWMKKHFTNS